MPRQFCDFVLVLCITGSDKVREGVIIPQLMKNCEDGKRAVIYSSL